MKKWMISLAALMAFLLTACNGETETQQTEAPALVEAEIIIPENAASQEEVPLQVRLTQAGDPVDDAHEVMFELWNDVEGSESERYEAEHVGDGVYEVNHTFEEDSVYTIQTHVTARDMHIMPKKQFVVGEVTEEQINTAEENAGNQESSHMDGDHEGHGEDEGHEH
ncbi:FixH family protein [Jeotgalibacillus proteolyticus]|uniref:YtkA-like domain-containing protein n=1 Tax=Jeotgalibacillus proteolyticus TaxID=2082395 RepID=A0A2S5GD88_9BACL|nr:FixH family protein [Jeotgalibacillus proteolyticus]PPA70885.1 hypothetical protein C4B60_08850 [Jeotgalibacillus proteolyticus]